MIIIFGSGGHGRSAADILLTNDPNSQLLFVDEYDRLEEIFGFKIVKCYAIKDEKCFIAIGDNQKREAKFNKLAGSNIISVISSKAYVSSTAKLGCGCFVGNFCHIGPEAVIGKNSIINTASVIEHEVCIGDHCHIAPRSIISGRTTLGDNVFVGAGTVIIDNIKVCSQVQIGAGAVVVNHITKPGTYVGVPARKINENWRRIF